MVHCVVIARNGYGYAWRFFDRKAARLHPLPQMDDVYATTGEELVEQYGRGMIDDLLRFAEGRDRVRLVNAFEVWKDGGGQLSPDAVSLLWSLVYQAAATPPESATELIDLIKGDRLFREGRVLRSIGAEERSSANSVTRSKRNTAMNDEVVRKRINENATITLLTEEGKNPKREGSAAYERFSNYRDGMTVKEAKDATITANDIKYDVDHGYISLTDPEPVEGEGEEGESEEAPKKKSRRTAAAA